MYEQDTCANGKHQKRGRRLRNPDNIYSRNSSEISASLMGGQPTDPSQRIPTPHIMALDQGGAFPPPFRPLQQPYPTYEAPLTSPTPASAIGTLVAMAVQPPSPMGGPPVAQFANPLFPRSRLPLPQAETATSVTGWSCVQLPPIRPPPERSDIDPALARQKRMQTLHFMCQEPLLGSSTRPKMDIQNILCPNE